MTLELSIIPRSCCEGPDGSQDGSVRLVHLSEGRIQIFQQTIHILHGLRPGDQQHGASLVLGRWWCRYYHELIMLQ